MNISTSIPVLTAAPQGRTVRFGQNFPYPTGPKDPSAADRTQQIRQFRRRRLPAIIGTFLLSLGSLGTAASMWLNAIDVVGLHSQISVPSEDQLIPDDPALTEPGNENTKEQVEAEIVLTDTTMQKLDEAYSEMLLLAAEDHNADLAPEDLKKRIDLLEAKRPEVLAMYEKLAETGDLENPGEIFAGLTEIFHEDLDPGQREKFAELQETIQGSDFDRFANSNWGGLVFAISFFIGARGALATIDKMKEYLDDLDLDNLD